MPVTVLEEAVADPKRLKSPPAIFCTGGNHTRKWQVVLGLFMVAVAWAMFFAIPVFFVEVPIVLWVMMPVIFGIGIYMFSWGFVVELL